jgi:hypothetical protein
VAKNKKHVFTTELTRRDLDYAEMILAWGRYLDTKIVPLEVFQAAWERENESRAT